MVYSRIKNMTRRGIYMILNSTNTVFTQEGAESESDLLASHQVLIYKSNSKISSMSYAGPAKEKIVKSSSIPEEFTNILKNIKGYVSLGTTKVYDSNVDSCVDYRNAHIYSSEATTLDGVERICYVAGIKNKNVIQISEYNSNKGAAYSSLYPILKEKMIKEGFVQNLPYDNFNITIEDASKLVDIINEVIEERSMGKYELIKDVKVDTITFGKKEEQKKKFFHVAYYREKNMVQDSSNLNTVQDILSTLNNIVRRIDIIDNFEDIEAVIKKLDSINKMANAKKVILEIKEEI